MLVGQHWHVNLQEVKGESHLWVYLFFFSNATCLILLGWFVRSEVSGCTAAVLCSAANRIWSKQHVVFLCISHLAFSSGVLLVSMWCIHTVVLIQPWGCINIIKYNLLHALDARKLCRVRIHFRFSIQSKECSQPSWL